jgi:hypothetical protein
MKLWKKRKKRKKQDSEQEDLTEKHMLTGKQPIDALGTAIVPLI